MNKYILYAFGAATLFAASGCSDDAGVSPVEATRAGALAVTGQAFGKGLPGIAHIKVDDSVAQEMQNVSATRAGGISPSSFPSSVATTLLDIEATDIEPLFIEDSRFKKRHHQAGLDRWYIVRFDKNKDLKTVMNKLAANPKFNVVEEVFKATIPNKRATPADPALMSRAAAAGMPFNDPLLSKQWHYQNFGTTSKAVEGADINLFEAWKLTTGKPDVIVSVVDGGIDITHPDLKESLWVNTKEIPGNGIDDDGNGYVDDIYGYNFSSNRGTITLDDVGHGTHVAGTIAARNNNGIGVGGVAGGDGTPESGVRVMSCQIFEGENGGDGARATVYGADNGAVISQNSWGYNYPGPGSIPASMKTAIDYFIKYAGCDDEGNQLPDSPMKGGVVIYAAGNDDRDYQAYPGAYAPVIAVSAMAPDWKKAWYTNRGDWVDIMAPGGDEFYGAGMVYSTVPASLYNGTQYAYMQGTSMACPHVSGIAALVVSKLGRQGFTNEELKQRLENSFRPADINANNPQYAGRLGNGYIDAARAMDINQNKKPGNVTDITAEATFTTLNLSWKAVTDEDDGTASKYLVYVSDKEISEENHAGVEPVTVNGSGHNAGDVITHTVSGLKDGTEYYVGIKAVDRWGLTSELVVKTLSTKKNNPPAITNIPSELVRVSGGEVKKFTVKATDPDGQKVTIKVEGETRGVSATLKADGNVDFSLRAVAPVGKYSIKLTATDELGASVSVEIPFEVYIYQPPTLTKAITDLIVGKDKGVQEIDLDQHFIYDKGGKFEFAVTSSNSAVAAAAIKNEGGSHKLVITPVKKGEATINVKLADGDDRADARFAVRVVDNSDAVVYQLYPLPAKTNLNVLLNPSVQKATLTVRSILGEKVLTRNVSSVGTDPVVLNVRKLAAGTYTLVVETGLGTFKKVFIKQ